MDLGKLIEQQMAESEKYTRQNFGSPMGPDFPELARAALANEKVCAELLAHVMMLMLSSEKVLKNVSASLSSSVTKTIANEPLVYSTAIKFLYWGIQIGRQDERATAEALQSVEKAS